MTVLALVRHQFRFDQKRFWRDPAGLFYAIGFPLIFLVNFLGVLGGNEETAHIAAVTAVTAVTAAGTTPPRGASLSQKGGRCRGLTTLGDILRLSEQGRPAGPC